MADPVAKAVDPQLVRQFQAVFADFDRQECEKLFVYLEPRHFAAGLAVWQPGEPMEFMGFLLDGRLVVKREGRFAGKYIILGILEKGTLFGETAVTTALQRHSVTLSAVEESSAFILTRAKIQELFRKEPLLAIKLLKKIVMVSGVRLAHTGARLAELL